MGQHPGSKKPRTAPFRAELLNPARLGPLFPRLTRVHSPHFLSLMILIRKVQNGNATALLEQNVRQSGLGTRQCMRLNFNAVEMSILIA